MNSSRLHSQLIVADILRCWQETMPVFLRHRMACIGCPLAGFETLEGAADVYGLELASFVQELEQVIRSTSRELRR